MLLMCEVLQKGEETRNVVNNDFVKDNGEGRGVHRAGEGWGR